MDTDSSVGALLIFFQNSCSSSVSDSIARNGTKFCLQFTNFKRWYYYNFFVRIFLGGVLATIFPEFWGKCRSRVLLNEIAQKSKGEIYIIMNNKYTLYVYIA